MTESEWNSCTDPQQMLDLLRGKVSERKLRLFAVACCRRLWHLLKDERSRNAVEVAEEMADGRATRSDPHQVSKHSYHAWMDKIHQRLNGPQSPEEELAVPAALDPERAAGTVYRCLEAIRFAPAGGIFELVRNPNAMFYPATEPEAAAQSLLLRDIFGPRFFRAVTINPAWLTSTVVSLGQAIYDERAFDHMPVLADALEESGCTNQEMLAHCRGGSEHVRGCWLIDVILGKS